MQAPRDSFVLKPKESMSFLSCIFLFSGFILANKPTQLSSTQEPTEVHQILVIKGDEKGFFEFTPKKEKITYKNTAGSLYSISLNPKGLTYFTKLFRTDFSKSDDIKKCLKKYLRYSSGSKSAVGCISSGSKISDTLTDITNELAALFADKKEPK